MEKHGNGESQGRTRFQSLELGHHTIGDGARSRESRGASGEDAPLLDVESVQPRVLTVGSGGVDALVDRAELVFQLEPGCERYGHVTRVARGRCVGAGFWYIRGASE